MEELFEFLFDASGRIGRAKLWGFSFTTKRLHDRGKSVLWLLLFYLVPGVLGEFAEAAQFGGAAGIVLHDVLALAASAMAIWGFVEIGCLRGSAVPNTHGSDPLLHPK